ncbi:MAG: iron ABC transporter permease, partial [Candidatus Heimdallarchaeota archaeon]|nr:iron ABC transporter permease [Candidatus Heimdallarchaeota archaeon]MCK4955956.1 iron ABC transporter permease [Candidatus Heimdallarchaeota archaeon]
MRPQTSLKKFNSELVTNRLIIILAILAIGSFLLSLFYIPIVKIFQFAFFSDVQFTFETFISTIADSINVTFLAFTFLQAFLSTLICIIIGIPAGYFFAKYDFRGKKLIVNLLTVPFVLPPIVVLLGFIVTYGQAGWVNILWKGLTGSENSLISIFGTFQGILLAHVFYNLSVIIRMTIPAWQSIDFEQVEVSRTLGVNRWKILWKIIFPQIRNYIISAALLVFIYTFNSFAIVLFLGEVRFQTLEVRIFKLMKASLNFPEGASLAILQLILNTIVIVFYLIFDRKTRQMAIGREKGLPEKKLFFSKTDWKQNGITLGSTVFILLIGLFTFAPILAVIIISFKPYYSGISPFYGYQQLLSTEYMPLLNNSPLRMLLNTLLFALITTIIT